MKHRICKLLIFAVAYLSATALQASEQQPEEKPQKHRDFYSFTVPSTPEKLVPFAKGAACWYGDKNMYTLRGLSMGNLDGNITGAMFNPTLANFVMVGKGKNGGVARVVVTNDPETLRYKHNPKKAGSATAACYTPDARSLLLATDRGILVLEPPKFITTDTFPSIFTPTRMTMSGNGNFLAMDDGNNVAVYNYADKRLRKKWRFDGAVTQIGFTPDGSGFAVLTSDGMLSEYDTRTFIIKKNIDGLGDGLDFSYSPDGKYVGVVASGTQIAMVNTLDDTDRDYIEVPDSALSSLLFIEDIDGSVILGYNSKNKALMKRLTTLTPYYGKLVADRAEEMMTEWLKMMPGETMEQYSSRVSEEGRRRQRQLFEDEVATGLAGDLVSMSKISLGRYDRTNQMLAVEFDNMPSIMLPVPESSVGSFADLGNLVVEDARYGIMANDNFELVYAKFHNKATGETFIYDNIDRVPLAYMDGDNDNFVTLEVLQQQQMEEIKLQELRERVVEEAKSRNVISDHTNISVNSKVESDYDADGNRILNYLVRFSYEVEPDYSIYEDFGPGKYHVEESGAASSMLSIVKQALEGDLAQYVAAGKKVRIEISGAADATPINRVIPYDGSYGSLEEVPVVQDGSMAAITVTPKTGITRNEQLAFLRGYGVKDYLEKNIQNLDQMQADYRYNISVSEGKGSQFRRIVAEIKFIDAL